ncbi:MAG: ABC transporter substrate-binding protein, partial [Firmicutes bacterium]|nr:ABC transporter substrate-binding protein [Bacillota bacterium]
MDKLISIVIAIALIFSISGCGANKSTAPEPAAQITDIEINVAALSGPTGMGMAYLNEQSDAGNTAYRYNISYASAPDQLTGGLISKEYQIAALPVNLASVLYNKTGGEILTAVVNTLGVLYVVEKGDSVKSLSDLAGKKVVASGQGSTPEYVFNYLLEKAGIKDQVEVEYVSQHDEAVSALASGKADLAMLPEPKVTAALMQIEGTRIALDLTEEWATVLELVGTPVLQQPCRLRRHAPVRLREVPPLRDLVADLVDQGVLVVSLVIVLCLNAKFKFALYFRHPGIALRTRN